jgi:hypothetical protein
MLKDGEAYLCQPALGNVPLSETNSRRAGGYFLTGLSAAFLRKWRTFVASPRRIAHNARAAIRR